MAPQILPVPLLAQMGHNVHGKRTAEGQCINDDKSCTFCRNVIPSLDQMAIQTSTEFHKESFVCTVCKMPLKHPHFIDGSLYCDRHAHNTVSLFPNNSIQILIRSNPETHQIANYNVYPAPAVALEKPISVCQTVMAHLVENLSMTELQEGFQSGYRRVLKEGGNYLVFSGLKINKMGRIKNELRQKQIMKFDSFHIRFRIGNEFWDTTPFKLVSSCTQLPKEIRAKVRPSKKAHHDEDEDANWTSNTTPPILPITDSMVMSNEASPPILPITTSSKGPGSIQFLIND